MMNLQTLMFLDLAIIFALAVFAYLSKHLGEALKIKPYYRFFFVIMGLVFSAIILDGLSLAFHQAYLPVIAIGIRFISGVCTLAIVLKYWSWLFGEFIKN